MNTDYAALPDKPRPLIAPENAAYWAGLREHKLLIQACSSCRILRHYPRPMCPHCYSLEYDWEEIEGRGAIYSWTQTHHPFHAGFKREIPYLTVTAELSAGVRIQGPLLDANIKLLEIGLPVVVEYAHVDDEITIPTFKLGTA